MAAPILQAALPFVALDRVLDWQGIEPLKTEGWGVVLSADLSGFTALSRVLVEAHGPRRGAEQATHTLNAILEEIIAPVHGWGGSVLGFSGDGFLCWFPARSTDAQVGAATLHAALHSAFAMQAAMTNAFPQVDSSAKGVSIPAPRLKVGIAAGQARRFATGDPARLLLDALAGAPVAHAVAAEGCAQPGEIWLDVQALAWAHPVARGVARRAVAGLDVEIVRIEPVDAAAALPSPPRRATWVAEVQRRAAESLDPQLVRPWLPSFVWERLAAGETHFLAELRPALAIFARFAPTQMGADAISQAALNQYVGWVQREFDAAGGTVIQLTLGDKGSYIYGVLGAPVQHDDTATRAARVAQALAHGPTTGDFRPQAQVGMAQGRMRAGEYGSSTRRTYGVQGSAVNLAARLMMVAQPGEVLVDPAAATLLDGLFELTPLPAEVLRGYATPVRVYRLTQASPRPGWNTRLDAMSLVRRTALLALLHKTWEEGVSQASGIVHLVGEAGAGKSALVWQFLQELGQPAQSVWVECGGTPGSTSYWLFAELLGRLMHPDRDAARTTEGADAAARDDLWQSVAAALAGAESTPDVAHALGGDIPRAVLAEALGQDTSIETRGLSIEQRRAVLAAFLLWAWQRAAQRDAVAVVLDEFSAADPESQAVIATFFQALAQDAGTLGTGVGLWVTTQRELPAVLDIETKPPAPILRVEGLSHAETEAFLEQRLHGPTEPLALDLLLRYSQGNPLYLTILVEELVKQGTLRQRDWLDPEESAPSAPRWTLAEEIFGRLQTARCLRRVDGVWRLRDDAALGPADLGLPDSLHRLVLTRIDRLSVGAGLTLRVLAVADAGLDMRLLAQAHPNFDRHDVEAELASLEAQGFVKAVARTARQSDSAESDGRVSEVVDVVYAIANSVVHDVVYESMLDRQRRALHSALAAAYGRWFPGRIEPVAYHLFRGTLETDEARAAAEAALDQAVQLAEARYAYETALGYVDCLLTLRRNWRTYAAKFEILHTLGLRAEQRALLDELVQAGDAPVVDAPETDIALAHARYFEAINDFDAAQRWTRRALAKAEEQQAGADRGADRSAAQVAALTFLGQIARRRGDFAQAATRYRAALQVVESHATDGADVSALVQRGEIAYGLGIAARHQGDFAAARNHLEQARDLFRAGKAHTDEALAVTALGVLAQMERRYDVAYELHARALALRKATNDWPGEGSSLVSMAQLRRAQGYHADAVRLLEAARRIHRTLRDRWWENRILNEIGVIYLIAGMLENARAALAEGLTLAERIGDRAGAMVILLNLGQVLRDLGDLPGARQTLTRSLEMAVARSEKYVEAQCSSDLARTEYLAGRFRRALDLSTRALSLLDELGLDTAATADLATQAEAHLSLGEMDAAHACALRIMAILDDSQGEGADFPQRDCWVAGRVWHTLGEQGKAQSALSASRRHLQTMADRFQDVDMRESFLATSPVNRAIVAGLWDLDGV